MATKANTWDVEKDFVRNQQLNLPATSGKKTESKLRYEERVRQRNQQDKPYFPPRMFTCPECKVDTFADKWDYIFTCVPWPVGKVNPHLVKKNALGIKPILPNRVFRKCPECGEYIKFHNRRHTDFPNVLKWESFQKENEVKPLQNKREMHLHWEGFMEKANTALTTLDSDIKDVEGIPVVSDEKVDKLLKALIGEDKHQSQEGMALLGLAEDEFASGTNRTPFNRGILFLATACYGKIMQATQLIPADREILKGIIYGVINENKGADTQSEKIVDLLVEKKLLVGTTPSVNDQKYARLLMDLAKRLLDWANLTKESSKKISINVPVDKMFERTDWVKDIVSSELNIAIGKGMVTESNGDAIYQEIQKRLDNKIATVYKEAVGQKE